MIYVTITDGHVTIFQIRLQTLIKRGQAIIPTAHYSDIPLLRRPIAPTAHFSDSPFLRQPIIPSKMVKSSIIINNSIFTKTQIT
jgi:hypothetical protein